MIFTRIQQESKIHMHENKESTSKIVLVKINCVTENPTLLSLRHALLIKGDVPTYDIELCNKTQTNLMYSRTLVVSSESTANHRQCRQTLLRNSPSCSRSLRCCVESKDLISPLR